MRTPAEYQNYQEVADYWNKYLEHNALRVKGGDTNAGAFLAWMIEAAGDMLRSAGERWPSPEYIFEKWNRLNNHTTSRDWTDPLSQRELEDIKIIKRSIEGIPAKTPYTMEIKDMLYWIVRRTPIFFLSNLRKLRPMIESFKDDWNKPNPKKRNPKGGFGDPAIQGVWQEEKMERAPGIPGGQWFIKYHKDPEIRNGLPYKKVSLISLSWRGSVGVSFKTQVYAHSLYPMVEGPGAGEAGVPLLIVNITISQGKAKEFVEYTMAKIDELFDHKTYDSRLRVYPLPNPLADGSKDPRNINRRLAAAQRAIKRLGSDETPIERIMRIDDETSQQFENIARYNMLMTIKARKIINSWPEEKQKRFWDNFLKVRYPMKPGYWIDVARTWDKQKNPISPLDKFDPNDAVTKRLADKAWALANGDIEGTALWLKAMGGKDLYISPEKTEFHITGPSGIRVGVSTRTDPINCAVQLGFAIAGMYWPQVFRGLLTEINRRWKERDRKPRRLGGDMNPIPEVIARWNHQLLKWNGGFQDYPPKNGKTYTLEELQKAVGGYIEILHIRRLPGFLMVINEEGKLIPLPRNLNATRLMEGTIAPNDYIAGNALVCLKSDIK